MKRKRIISFTLLLIVMGTLFTGCINKDSEIKSRLIIQGIGVDKIDSGKYKLSLQVFNTAVSGGQESGSSGNVTKVYTVEGDTVADAMRNATLITGRRPLYSHNWVVVISEEIARSGISSALDFFVRDYGMRSTVSLILSSSSAEDIIRSECGGSSIPAREINNSLEMWRYNAKTVNVDIYKAVNFLNDPDTELYLPIVSREKGEEKEDDTVAINGLGLFKGQYLKEKLTADEIRGFMFLNNQIRSGALVVPTSEFGKVSLEIIKSDTKIKTRLQNNKPHFEILIKCVCDINEIEKSNADLNKVSFSIMENKASQEIKNQSQSVFNRCIRGLNCDVFRLGDRFMQAYPKEYKAMQENHDELLKKAEVSFNVQTEIRRIGQKTAYPK